MVDDEADSPAETTPVAEPPQDAPTQSEDTRPPGGSDTTGESAAAPDDDAMGPIDADSLRIGPHVGRELFGDLFTDVTAYGPAQLGQNNTMHNYFGKRPLDPFINDLTDIDKLLDVYVSTGADEALDDLLSQRSTACLVGPRNSGRFSTARAALARRCKHDRVYEIVLPTDVSPEVLVDKPERLPEESGFVLRLSSEDQLDAMRKLAALFRSRSSALLLIRDEEPQRWELRGGEVRHHAPDAVEVFVRHLASTLTGGRTVAESYLTDDLTAALKGVYGPKESVAIARAIAKQHPADADAMRAILASSQPKRRERAAAILLPGPDGLATRGRRASQHERAFRLSYAVFYRRPLHYVFEATDWLLREIDAAALRQDWGNLALQHPVHELLGPVLKPDWDAGREVGKASLGTSRTAWMKDEGLRGAIIDVAWHEFDGTRKSLLQWLDRLVSEGDEVMRQAAAEAAGLLVHYDFDRVHEDLVDGWAASRKGTVRQAAAWTMTLSGMAGDAGPKVRAKLSQWCLGSSNYQRDTAARVYASGLEQEVLAWSIFDLARIAADKYQKRHHVVAEAVNQLYRSERAGWILVELATWAESSSLRIHAARALLALAARSQPDAADGRPDLLSRLAEGSASAHHLGRVWLVAFHEPETAPAAARALARWIRHADADDELRRPINAVMDAICTGPATRRRVEFYLRKTSGLRNGVPEWMQEQERRES